MNSALSPLDGRYKESVQELTNFFGEKPFFKYRLQVEILWAKVLAEKVFLGENLKIPKLEMSDELFQRIKEIEVTTKHDVKALEYAIKEILGENPAKKLIHCFCTSEDINSTALALQMKDFWYHQFLPNLEKISTQLGSLTIKYKNLPFPAKTHGQPASPTTFGKEMGVYFSRLQYLLQAPVRFRGKMSGATGSFHAHEIAFPKKNWQKISEEFFSKIKIEPNFLTTQIESREWLVEILDLSARINNVLLDLCMDYWLYIGLDYIAQLPSKGQVGSSTMPHKINPINFENAEGNLSLSNSILRTMSDRLLRSRMQRDLSCSTILRNLGVAYGYQLLAFKQIGIGLKKSAPNKVVISRTLEQNYSLLAEAIQACATAQSLPDAYEKIRILSQGKVWTKKDYLSTLKQCSFPPTVRKRLSTLSPSKYIGLSEKLAISAKKS